MRTEVVFPLRVQVVIYVGNKAETTQVQPATRLSEYARLELCRRELVVAGLDSHGFSRNGVIHIVASIEDPAKSIRYV